jgi:hypothetical protein
LETVRATPVALSPGAAADPQKKTPRRRAGEFAGQSK